MTRPVDPLPTGTVTFLLTDIEGSTSAWEAAPETMKDVVSRHYEILSRGIAAHGGQRPEEQGEGDSVVEVFRNPVDAATAALATQLELRRELPELKVRMSLHTGDAILRNESNYVGLTIIRCARIRGCGYGGQILISDDTKLELEAGLPPPQRAFQTSGCTGFEASLAEIAYGSSPTPSCRSDSRPSNRRVCGWKPTHLHQLVRGAPSRARRREPLSRLEQTGHAHRCRRCRQEPARDRRRGRRRELGARRRVAGDVARRCGR